MRRFFLSFVVLCALFLPFSGVAQTTLPALTGRVVDTAHALSPESIANLNHVILGLEAKTGGQFAIFIENHIPADTTLEERSYAIATHWKIGHKDHDNGALLYLAIKDRRNRLEIGYGWEGWVNDARAGDILRLIAPLLQEGRLEEALQFVVSTVAHFVEEKIPVSKPRARSSRHPLAEAIYVVIVLLMIGLTLWSMNPRQRERFIFLVYVHQLMLFLLQLLLSSRGSGRGGFGNGNDGFGGGGGDFGGGGASGRW